MLIGTHALKESYSSNCVLTAPVEMVAGVDRKVV